MTKRPRKRSNPLKIIILLVLIGIAFYFNQVVVPAMPMPFVPTPTVTRSPESIVNEAKGYFEEGKLNQAIEAYRQAVLADPKNPTNYIEMARIQVFASRYEDAKISAENALLLNPNNSMAHAVKAWALDYLGDYLEAEAAVKRALELDENNAFAYAYYAEILIDRGNFEELETAIALSHRAEALAPNALETHRIRGYVLFATGNYEEALTEYSSAIATNDKLWDLHYSMGAVYKLIGEYDQAVQEMLTAIALNPSNPDIPTDISRTYATIGQFGRAVQYAEQALSIDPSDPSLHGNLGVMLYKNGEYDRAAEELALAVRGGTTTDNQIVMGLPLSPGRVADDYYSIYGLSLTKQDRCADAVPIFQLIIQNIEDDQVAFYNAEEGMNYCRETINENTTEVPTTEAEEGELTPTP